MYRSRRLFGWRIAAGLFMVFGSFGGVRGAVPLAPPFALEEVDVAACAAGPADALKPVDVPTLISILGLHEKASDARWRGGESKQPQTLPAVHYRLAFTKPVTIGSLLVFGAPREASVLKADAPYPGDPAQPEHWQPLSIAARQSGGATATSEQTTTTRAVLLTDRTSKYRSELDAVRIWGERLHNVTPKALAYAEREYDKPSGNFSAPFLYSAARVTSGRAPWISAGPDTSGLIPVAPISDVAPTWFMLAWSEPQTLAGLWIDGNLRDFEIDAFSGAASVHPRTGTDAEWTKVSSARRHDKHGAWIEFAPTTTRGIRLRITKTSESAVAEIRGLHALMNLGTSPVPSTGAIATSAGGEPIAPKSLNIDMPYDGKLTLVVDGADGRRVKVGSPGTELEFAL